MPLPIPLINLDWVRPYTCCTYLTKIPVITVIALGVPSIFGGAIITENVFGVNGIGQLLITALFANDIPMVMTITFIFAIMIVAFNLVADVLYGVLDPRIRYD